MLYYYFPRAFAFTWWDIASVIAPGSYRGLSYSSPGRVVFNMERFLRKFFVN